MYIAPEKVPAKQLCDNDKFRQLKDLPNYGDSSIYYSIDKGKLDHTVIGGTQVEGKVIGGKRLIVFNKKAREFTVSTRGRKTGSPNKKPITTNA